MASPFHCPLGDGFATDGSTGNVYSNDAISVVSLEKQKQNIDFVWLFVRVTLSLHIANQQK